MEKVKKHGRPVQVQIPMLQIPVKDDASYLLYAICKFALDTKAFVQYAVIQPKLEEMHDGLTGLYRQLNIMPLEYGKFCILVEIGAEVENFPKRNSESGTESGTDSFGEEATTIEEEEENEVNRPSEENV